MDDNDDAGNDKQNLFDTMLSDLLKDEQANAARGPAVTKEQRLKDLRSRIAIMDDGQVFERGDAVDWKPGLSIMRSVGPFIFRGYLPEEDRRRFDDDPASAFYCEEVDCIIADIGHNEIGSSLIEWAVSSRRLTIIEDPKRQKH